MARPSATAGLLLVVLSLLTVAHCRTLGANHDTEPESTTAVAAGSIEDEEVLTAEQHHNGSKFLRLPSHRLHRHADAEAEHDEDEQVEELVQRFRKAIMGRRSGHSEDDSDDKDEQVEELMKRFRKAITRRSFGGHGEDIDDEDEQVEELVRRFRKVVMSRMFGHGAEDIDHHEHQKVEVLVWWFRKAIMRLRLVHGHGRRSFHHNHNHSHAAAATATTTAMWRRPGSRQQVDKGRAA